MKSREKSPKFIITLLFSFVVFCILLITMLLVGCSVYILVRVGILPEPNYVTILVTMVLASIAVGTVISILIGNAPVNPISNLISGLNALAAGNYHIRLSIGGGSIGKDLERSFNILAEELQNTEMLRSDFVNNFSHEFKTPLVSIQGFAKLLLHKELPEEKRQEYLRIIISESSRLADMATKVLDLTKLENQNILTEVSAYNLSEQLRECILLLEKAWTQKKLEISADFEEYQIRGNQEMLKQVWINLLGNAVKYAEPETTLGVSIYQETGRICVKISDCGVVIEEEEKARIFQKFYQTDASHTSQGNGIGLAIVKRIVELHAGEIQVESSPEETTFTVVLPDNGVV